MSRVKIYRVLGDNKLEECFGEGYETTADALKHLRVIGKAGETYITGLMGQKVKLKSRVICSLIPIEDKKGGD